MPRSRGWLRWAAVVGCVAASGVLPATPGHAASLRAALGALNPLLYRLAAHPRPYPTVFHDIVHGDDDLLGLGCCRATRGYDDASGLGSLDIGALAHVLRADPAPLVRPGTHRTPIRGVVR